MLKSTGGTNVYDVAKELFSDLSETGLVPNATMADFVSTAIASSTFILKRDKSDKINMGSFICY